MPASPTMPEHESCQNTSPCIHIDGSATMSQASLSMMRRELVWTHRYRGSSCRSAPNRLFAPASNTVSIADHFPSRASVKITRMLVHIAVGKLHSSSNIRNPSTGCSEFHHLTPVKQALGRMARLLLLYLHLVERQ
jgi:hypothetical protein